MKTSAPTLGVIVAYDHNNLWGSILTSNGAHEFHSTSYHVPSSAWPPRVGDLVEVVFDWQGRALAVRFSYRL